MTTINTFADIQNALDKFVGPPNSYPVGEAPHGVFWHNGATEDEQYQYFVTQDAITGFPIIKKGDGPNSNIVLALSGLPPFDGSKFSQMPISGPPFLDQPTIDAISAWITAGAKQFGDKGPDA